MVNKRWLSLALMLLLGLGAALPLRGALADEPANTKGFRKAVTLAGIRAHQSALQTIANENGGTRGSGTAGYNKSVDYVMAKLTAAGYSPVKQPFEFPFFRVVTPSVVQQVAPGSATYPSSVMTYSGSGDVTASLRAVDTTATPSATSTSGCEASDFAGFPVGSVALVQRGTCDFRVKAANAQAAGAVAVLVFNRGTAGNTGVTAGTLISPGVTIPTVGISFADGQTLYNLSLTNVTVRVAVTTESENRITYNVIAETADGDPNRTIVIGAHLDSVLAGPGINDNGSGSATILEIAEVFAEQDREARNKLRFIWFGAEELGLLGSNYYVAQLSQAQRDAIELNLNFDMVGSPNYVRFVYDGNNSAFPVGPGAAVGPAGSGEIEEVFHSYFASEGLASAETPFSGRSDYGPFIAVGIPAGGLFTGAEGIKTAEQAAIYGGTAGVAYDPCYHQACDTFANNSDSALSEMSDAAAHAVLVFSKRNFQKEPLADGVPTQGKGNGGEGGGLHDDHDHELPAS